MVQECSKNVHKMENMRTSTYKLMRKREKTIQLFAKDAVQVIDRTRIWMYNLLIKADEIIGIIKKMHKKLFVIVIP